MRSQYSNNMVLKHIQLKIAGNAAVNPLAAIRIPTTMAKVGTMILMIAPRTVRCPRSIGPVFSGGFLSDTIQHSPALPASTSDDAEVTLMVLAAK
jgi:hypothetical protein